MYDIRQFRPTLYLLLMLGFSAFALATSSPEIWVISTGLLLIHFWLTQTQRFAPLPRWLAGLITTVLFLYTGLNLWEEAQSRAVFILGQFLVFLQLVKLFELRGNRDYAQLLVLSVLLVVAAAINSASLLFGLVLIAHIFVALYCCLLFHLKLETDQAKAVLGLSEDNVPPETLRQDQRYLGRSMRRLTFLVSAASIVSAVLVFLFFPRGSGANVFSPLQFRASQSLTGFSDEVSFNNIAQITQNSQLVARVRVWRNGNPVQGTAPLLLRGRTYNIYSGARPSIGPPFRWTNSATLSDDERLVVPLRADDLRPLPGANADDDQWRQEISLEANGSRSLFAIAGPTSISISHGQPAIFYHLDDETLELQEPVVHPLRYEVVSRNSLRGNLTNVQPVEGDRWQRGLRQSFWPRRNRAPMRSAIDPAIAELARRPEVSGVDDAGPLAARRTAGAAPSELDLQIAHNVESFLRANFQYTLDLTDVSRLSDRDPLEVFLTETRRGHCEFFAGAMTLLLQSLGIEARMVTGFRSDEYNTWGEGFYIVRQSHAHAWVEVRGPEGWHTFDPTSSRLADATTAGKSIWQQLKHAFNYLEYLWAESVVAYDRESRSGLITATGAALDTGVNQASDAIRSVRQTLQSPSLFYSVTVRVITGLVFLMLGFLLALVGWFVFERWRLRQRARRIGLDSLPKSDQLRLARQLEFYDRLTQLLQNRGISRPAHATPREFCRSISFLPAEAYDAVQRLTEVFYRVRYGRRQLSPAQQRRLKRSVDLLQPHIR
ncbi:MAG: DUF3488 and transglutaminase-like domain-containing protein [Phycisphaerae bacterium]|nr:DUF3488 and transglutaminase-like domain-containing protein [Phycisphaerae bacterium]MDW8261738.1 DUF3488 and transglutaminase-like domain-containing protein [Phycisphaerales bacterium]